MKRRTFLQRIAPTLAAPVLFNGMSLRTVARPLRFYERLQLAADTDRVLVIIQLEGGNDGLNMVIPVEDDHYYALRPTLGIAKPEALALAGEPLVRLHPSMTGMQRMFDDGELAIVGNIGYDGMTLSHFAGTEIWNTASAGSKIDYLDTGWVGRYLQGEFPDFPDTLPADPPAIEISAATSSIFTVVGASIGMSLTDPEEFYRLVSAAPAIDDEVDEGSPAGREWAFIESVNQQSRSFADTVRAAYNRASSQTTYPDSSLARSLAIIARLVAGGLRTRIYKVTLGGFDTHGAQAATHRTLLGMVSGAIKAFQDDLVALGVAGRVVGMTYSEFGRRARENGQGTDHGTAAPHFVFGSAVDGGKVFGRTPDLANLDASGNLVHTIDFHCYYASVLAPLFGVDNAALARILPFGRCNRQELVPLYRSAGLSAPLPGRPAARLTIHPNPASHAISVHLAGGVRGDLLRVIDSRGMVVIERRLVPESEPLVLDLSGLSPGEYIVTAGGSSEKLVVVR